jgi:hypothetical protein
MSFPSTFLDMQSTVIEKARLDQVQDLDRVKDWLNGAYYEACIETNFFEAGVAQTAPLAADTTSVGVPSNLVKVEYVTPIANDGTLWGPIQEVTLAEILELRAWQGGASSTGAPSRYAYRSSQTPTIEFWPQAVGGEILNFWGTTFPPLLALDTDLPIFPPPYSAVIEYGALQEAAEFQKDILTLQGYQGQHQDWLQRLRALVNLRTGSMVQQFRVERQRPWPQKNSVDTGV